MSESPVPIAPSGSLAAGATTTVTVTATDSAGDCVSGAPIYLFFAWPGYAYPDTAAKCPVNNTGSLTPNWAQCTTDSSGTVTILFQTPSPLPNGGSSSIEATSQAPGPAAPTPQATTSYTYASMSLTAHNIAATEGELFSGSVATMTFQNFTYTPQATIDWGDNTTSVGSVIGTANGTFVVDGSHTYQEENPRGYTITVTGYANDAPTVTSTGSASVADAPLSAWGTSLAGRARHLVSGVVATFSDADPAGTVSDYTATVYWGDGTSSTGTVSTGSSGYSVSASHTYPRKGGYTITVNILDAGGSSTTGQSSASIR